jgi:hypothetical protein
MTQDDAYIDTVEDSLVSKTLTSRIGDGYHPVTVIDSYNDSTASGRDKIVEVLEYNRRKQIYRVRRLKTEQLEQETND